MYPTFKRVMDIMLCIIVLPVLLLLCAIITIAIKLDDGGPILYKALRIGKSGKLFTIYKFRTMIVNAPDIRTKDGKTWNAFDDFRVTRVGKFLRKSSLDEIPQIFNILNGEMSLVGIRPDPPDAMEQFTEEEKYWICSILPGITGYNQVYFRNAHSFKQKAENDVYHAKHQGFWFELVIFLKTFSVVLKQENIYITQDAHSHQLPMD